MKRPVMSLIAVMALSACVATPSGDGGRFELDGLSCRQDLAEWSTYDFGSDVEGDRDAESASLRFVRTNPRMVAGLVAVDAPELLDTEFAYADGAGHIQLIVGATEFPGGWVIGQTRRCAP